MTDNSNLKCSGYKIDKHKAIKKHSIDWNKLKMHYWIDTKLNHYAVYQDLVMQVKEQSKLTTG